MCINTADLVLKIWSEKLCKLKLEGREYTDYLMQTTKRYYYGVSIMICFSQRINYGRCYDFSSYCLDIFDENSFIVNGYLIDETFSHQFIEFKNKARDDVIFDTTFMSFIKKEDYYKFFKVKEVCRSSRKESLKESIAYREVELLNKKSDETLRLNIEKVLRVFSKEKRQEEIYNEIIKRHPNLKRCERNIAK